jgi:hypothetical protein
MTIVIYYFNGRIASLDSEKFFICAGGSIILLNDVLKNAWGDLDDSQLEIRVTGTRSGEWYSVRRDELALTGVCETNGGSLS